MLLVEGGEPQSVTDDEDLDLFLSSIDNENRRCMLLVEVIRLEKVSTYSSFGKNYDEVHCNADGVMNNGDNEEAKQQPEAEVKKDGDDDTDNKKGDGDDDADNKEGDGDDDADNKDGVERPDEYVEVLAVDVLSQVIEPWEDGLGVSLLQEFPSRKALQDVVGKAAFVNSFSYVLKKTDRDRLVLTCSQKKCRWRIRGSRIKKTTTFSIRRYNKMHTCSMANQSSSKRKRRGTPELVASLLHDMFPGQLETPTPKIIMELVKTKVGVNISYSTTLRGKNKAVSDLCGNSEESYKMIKCYLFMLEKVNRGTKTSLKLDENGKFKYLFIALGASIEGFEVMRKVIIVDATFLKNGYGGVLVFASAQDHNRHHYPIAFAVLNGENNDSWNWFFDILKTVVLDSSELVFMSDRNASLIAAICNVYPQAHHAYCVWHLSQNVKGHVSNANKDVVAWRFMECSRCYTVAEFNRAYSSFKTRYPSAAKYLEDSTVKEKWARCCFPGERYNIDTSNAVESLNSVFKDARKYSLIPMLDTIFKTLSHWFNEHRKEAVCGSIDHKLVPLVENYLHDLWGVVEKLKVTELNSFEMEYNVIDIDGKPYLVNLLLKTCGCRVFDIEKYPCVHAVDAFIDYSQQADRARNIQLHELCSKYYWSELWAMAYYRTIFLVPDKSQWDVPDDIKEVHIIPPPLKKKKGRRRVKRFPSTGEKRQRTQNKRRQRQGLQWLLFGANIGS